MKRNLLITSCAVVLVAIVSVSAWYIFRPKETTITEVNGEKISKERVDKEIARLKTQSPEVFTQEYANLEEEKIREKTLRSLIEQKLLLQEARKRGIKPSKQQVEKTFSTFEKSYPNADDFQKLLKRMGLSEKELKSAMEDNLTIKALGESLVPSATEGELKAYFEKNKDHYASTSAKRVSQILFDISDSKTAALVHAKLQSGADFATCAKNYSKDVGSAQRGGDLGWSYATYPKEFEAQLVKLSKGQFSSPFSTSYGIHIIKVTDTKSGTVTFASVKRQVETDYLNKRRSEEITKLLEQLKTKAKIG